MTGESKVPEQGTVITREVRAPWAGSGLRSRGAGAGSVT